MSRWTPCKRRDLVNKLHALGFTGPYAGTRHELMRFQGRRLSIPSYAELSVPKLREFVAEVESLLGRPITLSEWNGL